MLYEKDFLWENNDEKENFSRINDDDDDDPIFFSEKDDEVSIIEGE